MTIPVSPSLSRRLSPPSTFSRFALSRATSRFCLPCICFLLRSLPSALLSLYLFLSSSPSALGAHTRTARSVSISLPLFLSLFPVPTTKNVANVRIDRSLSRALPPFFTLLPSANPLSLSPLYPPLASLSLSSTTSFTSSSTFSTTLSYSFLRSPLPYSPSALHARTYFFCR